MKLYAYTSAVDSTDRGVDSQLSVCIRVCVCFDPRAVIVCGDHVGVAIVLLLGVAAVFVLRLPCTWYMCCCRVFYINRMRRVVFAAINVL